MCIHAHKIMYTYIYIYIYISHKMCVNVEIGIRYV